MGLKCPHTFFTRVKIRPHSGSVTVIYPDRNVVTRKCPECEPGAALQVVVSDREDDAVRLVQHGL